MKSLLIPGVCGFISLLAALISGYVFWHRQTGSKSPASDRYAGAGPIAVGLLAGGFGLVAGLGMFIGLDRFYSVASAYLAMSGIGLSVLIILGSVFCGNLPQSTFSRRFFVSLIVLLLSATIATVCGIRFRILDLPYVGVVNLGKWSMAITITWLLFTTGSLKLLDGLFGAASIVLIVAGGAGIMAHIAFHEYFLTAVSLVFCGAALGALRFNISKDRLPLRGVGTLLVGFLFGILTVLARQKALAAVLLLSPIVVIVILAGGAMLSFLERSLLPAKHDDTRTSGSDNQDH